MFLIAYISLYSLSPTSIHVLLGSPSCCVKLCDFSASVDVDKDKYFKIDFFFVQSWGLSHNFYKLR